MNQLRSFESEVRQLLDGYKKQQEELQTLRVLLSSKDEEIGRLQTSIRSYERAYSNLKTARMLEVSDGDIRTAKLRITRLVREVNKCIRLLSAEMGDIGDSPESASSEREQETVQPPTDRETVTSVESDSETEIEIDLTQEASEEVALEPAKETSDIDSESDKSPETSTNDSDTPEDDAGSSKDEPETPDLDAEPSKDERKTAEPVAAPSDDKTETADDATESLKSEQQPSDEETAPSKKKESPAKESSETPKVDSKPESLLLEIESESEPSDKERDLWADFGMLPLFSDDEPKQ